MSKFLREAEFLVLGFLVLPFVLTASITSAINQLAWFPVGKITERLKNILEATNDQ